jgi:RNA polymerase sigma factor (sigma-70 family)
VVDTLGLIESYIPALRRYAGFLLRDRQEVDDLVHDCLVRALDKLHTRQGDAGMRSWLFAIMHNLYISRMRQARVRGRTESIDTVAETAVSVKASQEDHAAAQSIGRAIARLPENLRSVLLLVTVEDLTYAEVSKVLNIPIGTVMSRLSRARERIRQQS